MRGTARNPEFCIIFGTNEGAALPLADRILSLGRELENDIVLDGAAIAGKHATIELASTYVVIEAAHPVWVDGNSQGQMLPGRVEVGYDIPFRIGSSLCVVTKDPGSWFERDVSDFVAQAFGQGGMTSSANAGEAEAMGEPRSSSDENEEENGSEAVDEATVGAKIGTVDKLARIVADERPAPSWRQRLRVLGCWRIYDGQKLRRGIVAALVLAFLVVPIVDRAAIDRAHAWVRTGMQSFSAESDSVAGTVEIRTPSVDNSRQEELEALIRMLGDDGQLSIVRSADGAFAVRGFVMSRNAHVRLLSGLSMLPFPVEMQVQDRGSQVRALELLVSHTKDANLKIAVDSQTGHIRLTGTLPTQAQVDKFVAQVKLELSSIADFTWEVESTDTVARRIAERARLAGLSQIQILRSTTKIVVTGAASLSEMKQLDEILAQSVTHVPVENRVKLYQDHDSLRLTAGDLGLMAVILGTQPVVVDHSGNRFQVGDVLKGGFRIVNISFDEVLVRQGSQLAEVAFN